MRRVDEERLESVPGLAVVDEVESEEESLVRPRGDLHADGAARRRSQRRQPSSLRPSGNTERRRRFKRHRTERARVRQERTSTSARTREERASTRVREGRESKGRERVRVREGRERETSDGPMDRVAFERTCDFNTTGRPNAKGRAPIDERSLGKKVLREGGP